MFFGVAMTELGRGTHKIGPGPGPECPRSGNEKAEKRGRLPYFVAGGTRVICQVNVYSCVSPGMVSGNLTVLPPES